MATKKTQATTTAQADTEIIETVQETTLETEATSVQEKTATSVRTAKQIPPNTFVVVRNGFHGTLVYKSPRTRETYIWNEFGDELELEFVELKSAKTARKAFFMNNWFMIDDWDVIDALGVGQFYKNALTYENFDGLFKMSPNEIANTVAKLSDEQKNTVAYRAKELISNGEIDSMKVIRTLEQVLGREFVTV